MHVLPCAAERRHSDKYWVKCQTMIIAENRLNHSLIFFSCLAVLGSTIVLRVIQILVPSNLDSVRCVLILKFGLQIGPVIGWPL